MLKITDPNLLSILESIEGKGFEDGREEIGFSSVTTVGARKLYIKHCGLVDSVIPGATIYGVGGWNRYFVLFTGEVVFSAYHGKSDTAKAEAAGIRVWR